MNNTTIRALSAGTKEQQINEVQTQDLSAKIATNAMLAAVVLEPTCILRLNMFKNRNGTLEQMWIDKINNKEYWKTVPSVYVNNDS